ncbi:surface lipoprotein assembly modifier, partial [Neisseria sp. SLRRB23]|uniref:surface lipoprotein assembly modifier n=1 Tax=Neisseria sp. SLRRB23 TaxID=3435199 RepID=UPI003D7F8F42
SSIRPTFQNLQPFRNDMQAVVCKEYPEVWKAYSELTLADNHYLLFRANVGGTSYYFSRKSAYDDAFGRAYLGWQYKNARQTVGVLPFYQVHQP